MSRKRAAHIDHVNAGENTAAIKGHQPREIQVCLDIGAFGRKSRILSLQLPSADVCRDFFEYSGLSVSRLISRSEKATASVEK